MLLVAVWLAFTFPVLGGRTPFPVGLDRTGSPGADVVERVNPYDSDAYDQYYVWRSYLGSRLRAGSFPLWDPHRFAGTPFAANPQAAVFYPPNWAFALGSPLFVWTLTYVLGILAALLLAYWFLRVCALHPMACGLGAVVFVFSGFLVAWRNHPTFLSSAMWLPLALGALEKSRVKPPRIWIPVAGLALGLSVLGGHTQVSVFVWLVVGLWSLVAISADALRSGTATGVGRRIAPIAGRLGAAFATGAGVSAIQTLPSLEFAGHIVRTGTSASEAITRMSLPLSHVATIFAPDRLGNPLDGNYVGAVNYTETTLYTGLTALVLAGVGLWGRRDRITASFVAVGLTGALAAWGTPVYRLLHVAIPGLDQIARPNRFVFLVDVAVAGLAAIGLDALLRAGRRALPWLGASSMLVAAGLAISLWTGPALETSYVRPLALRGSVFVLASGGIAAALTRAERRRTWAAVGLIAVLTADLWMFGFRYHPFAAVREVYAETDQTRDLSQRVRERDRVMQSEGWSLPMNAGMVYRFYDIGGYDSFVLRNTYDTLDPGREWALPNVVGPFGTDPPSPVIDLLGVRFALAPPGGTGAVVERQTFLPPAFVVACWLEVDPGHALAELMSMDADRLRTVALVDRGKPLGRKPARSSEDCIPGPAVRLVRYEPEHVSLRVNVDRPSILVLTDSWYPGWRARVDGLEAEVLRVDHAFRGVLLPEGANRVEMYFRPVSMVRGAALTMLTLAFCLSWAFRPTLMSRSGSRGPGKERGHGRRPFVRG